jgi:hypothetical protein
MRLSLGLYAQMPDRRPTDTQHPEQPQRWAERPVPVRLREEVQAVLRRGDCELRRAGCARNSTIRTPGGRSWGAGGECSLSLPSPPESYTKATDRRIFLSSSAMAKSLGTPSKSFEISDK